MLHRIVIMVLVMFILSLSSRLSPLCLNLFLYTVTVSPWFKNMWHDGKMSLMGFALHAYHMLRKRSDGVLKYYLMSLDFWYFFLMDPGPFVP